MLLRIVRFASSARLDELGRAIFGTLPPSRVRTGNKLFRKRLKGPLFADYYFDVSGGDVHKIGREVIQGWLSDKQERRVEKLETLRRRGKGPPKKGQGKRAKKK
ncbi:hypothetical protein CTAYLR_000347 [Chrysophaeum taylorii]|uniref:Small ribosomal subunit protein mS33 n=1 Tax=Chrysophaeum taylorii TaxID=2483200 RepID=A0AAD7XQG3_9STRA|nr:hypothetical protein CTAYLR_000347 [Chrysophaeum taylorii]